MYKRQYKDSLLVVAHGNSLRGIIKHLKGISDTDISNLNLPTAVPYPMSVRMAVTIVATVPIVIVYPFLQKYFIGGMTLGSVND